jgi:hypothetical protein
MRRRFVNPRFRLQITKITSRDRLFSQAHIGDLTIISILCAAAGIATFLSDQFNHAIELVQKSPSAAAP